MAKRNSKRRSWTASEVRELKSAAPLEKNREKSEAQRGRDAAKGFQYWLVTRLARPKSDAKGRIIAIRFALTSMVGVLSLVHPA